MNKEERREYVNKWARDRYEYRKTNRLCTYCGKPLNEDENNLCTECRENEKNRAKEIYHYYQNNGICPVCREVKLLPGEKRCAVCKRFRNSYPRSERKRQTDRDNHIKMRARRSEKGLCTICGTAPADEGRSTCTVCRTHKNLLRRIRIEKYRNSSRCTTCGKPILNGNYLTCLDCRRRDAIRKGCEVIPDE